jgi:hypothetical protein
VTLRSSLQTATVEPRTAVAVSIALFIATFLVTRQTQIPAVSGLAAPWALLVTLAWLRRVPSLAMLAPMLAYGFLSMLASLVAGRDPGNVVRFFAVTTGTLLAVWFKPAAISVRWTLLPIALQAVAIIVISVGLSVLQDPELASTVRLYALAANWGDIYSFDGVYYRVQIIGNALVPLLFLIAVWRWDQGRYYRAMAVLSLLGILAAGNLTYLLVAVAAVLLRHARPLMRHPLVRMLLAAGIAIGCVFAWNAIDEVIERKFEGSDSSMGVRFDQIDVAQAKLTDSPAALLFGTGLGASFPDGRERNYSEYQYIELQSLYLFLQLGVVGMSIYLVTLVLGTRRFLDSDGRRIFWLYMLCGATNPYILDTNQIIATLLLVCLFPRAQEKPARSGRGSPARIAAARP